MMISIHAPRMGSDYIRDSGSVDTKKFQSTLPGWGATVVHVHRQIASMLISIHAPRMGSDQHATVDTLRLTISIHAPRMGSDRLHIP